MPDHGQGILKVQIVGQGSNCADRAFKPLREELTATETVYLGTDLNLVYELSAEDTQTAQTKIMSIAKLAGSQEI